MMTSSIIAFFDQVYLMLPQPTHGRSIVFVYGPHLDHLDGFLLIYTLTFVCFFLNSDNRFNESSRINNAQSTADIIPEFNANFTQTENLGFIMSSYYDELETHPIGCA
jgi:hypothetical protein